VTSLDTVTTAVATTGFSCVHGAVAARFYAHPDVRFVPLEGAPVVTAVATRRDDDRPIVQAFRAAARHMATVDPAGSEGRSLPSSHMIAPPGR
jgi:DNA-binding transcriptional LysR family regulator